MKQRILWLFIGWLIFGVLYAHPAVALNEPTHVIINEQAVRQSGSNQLSIDQVLKEQLGFPEGIQQPLRGRQVFEWIGEGGVREDAGIRFFRHFHDPLRPWGSAGFGFFDSSIRWMQSNSNPDGSWQAARGFFFNALTSSNKDDRDQGFADTFLALGQIMHLVVDASVPEHVRNDAHPSPFCIFATYECWVETNFTISGSFQFASAILQQPTNDAQAPVPIARLIDTDTYTGLTSGPNVTLSSAIGIGEFANANFFSESTGGTRLLGSNYPFPDRAALLNSQFPAPKTGRVRAYYKKGPNDGLPVDPVLAECALDEAAAAEGIAGASYACTDENVWAQVAQTMLPRAVGYAKGILDYFFRGTMEVMLSEKQSSQTSIRVKVKNTTPDEDTMNKQGELVGVLQYTLSGEEFFVVSPSQQAALTRDFQELVFNLVRPAGAEDTFLSVVYKGQLGLEEGAVMVGRTSLLVVTDDFNRSSNTVVRDVSRGKFWKEVESNETAWPPFSVVGFAPNTRLALRYRVDEDTPVLRAYGYMYWDQTNNDKFSGNQAAESFLINAAGSRAAGFAGIAVRLPVGVDNPEIFTGICAVYEGDYTLILNADGQGNAATRVDYFLRIYAVVNGSLRHGGNAVTDVDPGTGAITRSFAPGWNILFEEFVGSFAFQATADPNKFRNKVHKLNVRGDSITLTIVDGLEAGSDKVINVASDLVSGGQKGDSAPGFVVGTNMDEQAVGDINNILGGTPAGSQVGDSVWDDWVGRSL